MVFAGEYAAQSVGMRVPTIVTTGSVRFRKPLSSRAGAQFDVVRMSSYAPLFGHVDAWQWTPNMIWFDNLRSYGTPNYYVQKMFSVNKGTRELPVLLDGSAKNGQS
jgi:alpha-N-arabinofuranosidase